MGDNRRQTTNRHGQGTTTETSAQNMEGGESDLGSDTDENCIFCLIANDQDKHTEIIQKNDELVCFQDICPAAPHHYLVIPRQHIHSCFSLHNEHVGLVKRMTDMGKAVLRGQGITNMKDIRLGFHQPPYTSVDHLHLHVLAPASQITHYMAHKFIPNTCRFINEDHLRKRLNDTSPNINGEGKYL